MRPIIAALILLVCAAFASASEYVLKDGYYFRGGSSQAYERYTDYYWVNGYYAYDSYRCKYVWYPGYWQGYYAYKPVKLDVYADDFATQALKVAAARDKFVLQSQANLALVDKLGLNVYIPNYGAGLFRSYGNQYYAPTSIYEQRVDVYGVELDPNIVTQGINRAIDRTQEQVVQLANVNGLALGTYERINIARENRKAAVGVAQALAPKSTHIETKSVQVGPARIQGAVGNVRIAAANACVSCHAGDGANVKAFDISRYDPATADGATIERVFKYIRTGSDPHCPPGKQLTADQIAELIIPKEGAK